MFCYRISDRAIFHHRSNIAAVKPTFTSAYLLPTEGIHVCTSEWLQQETIVEFVIADIVALINHNSVGQDVSRRVFTEVYFSNLTEISFELYDHTVGFGLDAV